MVHYDGSRTDEGAAAWFRDPRCRFGYTWLVLDDARVVELATREQVRAIITLCVGIFRAHRWGHAQVGTRLVGHDEQAIWTPATTREAGMSDQVASARWGRLGRKQDPTGLRGDKRPIVDMTHVRTEVRQALELARSIGRCDHVRLAA